jgi:putative transposase
MKVKKEEYIDGAIFHFYNRTVENELLFREDQDYLLFLRILKKALKAMPVKLYTYCLMPNHFHFLIQQGQGLPVFRLFNALLSSYVQRYNKKYKRRGSLMGGPLQSKYIENNEYLINVSRYIHLNPLKANLVSKLEDWKYSNYSEWIGKRRGSLFNPSLLIEYFDTGKEYENSIQEYINWMADEKFTDMLFDSK